MGQCFSTQSVYDTNFEHTSISSQQNNSNSIKILLGTLGCGNCKSTIIKQLQKLNNAQQNLPTAHISSYIKDTVDEAGKDGDNDSENRTIFIVNGYTKQIWKQYKMIMWYPSNAVIDLILLYLDMADIFDEKYCHKNIKIDHKSVEYENNNYICSQTIRRSETRANVWYHVFGSDIVKKGDIKIWTFKVFSSWNRGSLIIGIIESNQTNINIGGAGAGGDFTDYFYGFGLCTDNGTVYHNENIIKKTGGLICGRTNDIIIMELDMKSFQNYGVLKYKINNNKQISVYTEINMEKCWQLAVALHDNSELALIPNTAV